MEPEYHQCLNTHQHKGISIAGHVMLCAAIFCRMKNEPLKAGETHGVVTMQHPEHYKGSKESQKSLLSLILANCKSAMKEIQNMIQKISLSEGFQLKFSVFLFNSTEARSTELIWRYQVNILNKMVTRNR